MLSWLFDRWCKSRSLTSDELTVLRLFFSNGGLSAERLYSQAINAPYIERRLIGKDGYEAIIPYVIDDSMLIECEEEIESPTILVSTSTGSTLKFSVKILRGGFLRGLKGESVDGSIWKKNWSNLDFINSHVPDTIDKWIPQSMSNTDKEILLDQLFQWCGIVDQQADSIECRAIVRLEEPAPERLVSSCETRIQTRLGEQYRQLLAITNGFGLARDRPYEFLGTRDVYFINGDQEWLCLTPLYEEGCVAIQCHDGIASDECFILTNGRKPNHIGDVKQYVRDVLLRLNIAI